MREEAAVGRTMTTHRLPRGMREGAGLGRGQGRGRGEVRDLGRALLFCCAERSASLRAGRGRRKRGPTAAPAASRGVVYGAIKNEDFYTLELTEENVETVLDEVRPSPPPFSPLLSLPSQRTSMSRERGLTGALLSTRSFVLLHRPSSSRFART